MDSILAASSASGSPTQNLSDSNGNKELETKSGAETPKPLQENGLQMLSKRCSDRLYTTSNTVNNSLSAQSDSKRQDNDSSLHQ